MKFDNKIVRAGAGAGKTTNLTTTLAAMATTYFEATKKWPRFVVTTFTRKATQELFERLQKLNTDELFQKKFVERKSHLWVTTIHGILLRFINEYGSSIGILPGLTLVPENMWGRIHRKVLRQLLNGNPEFQKNWSHLVEIKSWQELVKQFQNYFELKLINPLVTQYPWQTGSEFLIFNQAFMTCADLFNSTLLETKISQAKLSMSDLEPVALYMIRQNPDLALQFSSLWDYWFIDEFQDTSPIQKELLWSLSGKQKKYVVGDPQQSIYLFRGAQSTLFDLVESDFDNKSYLTTNYRTQPSLLLFFNSVFTSLSPQFRQMEPRSSEVVKETIAKWVICQDSESEILAALREVQVALDNGTKEDEIVILSRSNANLLKLEKQAKKNGLNIKVTTDVKFYKIPLVREALVSLYCMINPFDELNLSEMLRTSFFDIDEKTFLKMCAENSAKSRTSKSNLYFEAQKSLDTNPSFQKWKKSIDTKNSVLQCWLEFLNQHQFIEKLNSVDPAGELQTQWTSLVLWLEKSINTGARKPLEIVDSLLTAKEVEDLKFSYPPLINKNQVQAMTIHASKGLQFEHVIVVGTAKNLKASSAEFLLTSEDEKHWTLNIESESASYSDLENETVEKFKESYKKIEALEFDRLAYVALTRAKSKVVLISSGKKDLSWVYRMGLKSDPGLHHTKDFTYEVEEFSELQNTAPQMSVEAPPVDYLVTKSLNPKSSNKAIKSVSPTYLVEKLVEIQNQLTGKADLDAKTKTSGVALLEGLQKANYGTVIHAQMEELRYKDLQSANKPPVALDFLSATEWKSFSAVIKEGFAEYGFIIDLNKHLKLSTPMRLQGQIDLWGFDSVNEEFVVADYKTGSSHFAEKAFIQMDIYAMALKMIGVIPKTSKVQLQALFLNEKKVMGRQSQDFDSVLKQLEQVLSS